MWGRHAEDRGVNRPHNHYVTLNRKILHPRPERTRVPYLYYCVFNGRFTHKNNIYSKKPSLLESQSPKTTYIYDTTLFGIVLWFEHVFNILLCKWKNKRSKLMAIKFPISSRTWEFAWFLLSSVYGIYYYFWMRSVGYCNNWIVLPQKLNSTCGSEM